MDVPFGRGKKLLEVVRKRKKEETISQVNRTTLLLFTPGDLIN